MTEDCSSFEELDSVLEDLSTSEELKSGIEINNISKIEEIENQLNEIKGEMESLEDLRKYLNDDSPGIIMLNNLCEAFDDCNTRLKELKASVEG